MSKFRLTRLTFNIHKRFFTAKPLVESALPTNASENATISSSSFTIEYLTNSCGLSLKSAILVSKRVNLVIENKPQYDSVVEFLKSNEFSDTQVVKLVQKHPAVLSSHISAILQPKFQLFTENGVSSSVVPKIFLPCPEILWRSVDAQLKPVMQLLREYITCDDKLKTAIVCGAMIFTCDFKNRLRPNVEFLIQQGVPRNRISHLVGTQPRCLFYPSFDRFVHAVDRMRVMGVKPSDKNFILALRTILTLSKLSWKRKVEVFESMGWSYDEVVSMFVHNPVCLCYSEKKLRDTMDFLVNTVKIDPKIVIGYPKVFSYSLEKRMVPRYTVWKMLKERDQIQKRVTFFCLLNKSEDDFTDSYVKRFSTEIANLESIYDQRKKLGRAYV